MKTALKDASEKVVTSAKQIFLPSFAMWAYELGKLEHSLLHGILRDLEELVKAIPLSILTSRMLTDMIFENLLHVYFKKNICL